MTSLGRYRDGVKSRFCHVKRTVGVENQLWDVRHPARLFGIHSSFVLLLGQGTSHVCLQWMCLGTSIERATKSMEFCCTACRTRGRGL